MSWCLKWMFWGKKISLDLSMKLVSGGHPTLHQHLGSCFCIHIEASPCLVMAITEVSSIIYSLHEFHWVRGAWAHCLPGPLFIKRWNVTPPNIVKSRSNEIYASIALQYGRRPGSTAVGAPVQLQKDTIISRSILQLRYFTRSVGKTSYCLLVHSGSGDLMLTQHFTRANVCIEWNRNMCNWFCYCKQQSLLTSLLIHCNDAKDV